MKLIANMLVQINSEDDVILTKAAIESVLSVVDEIIILDTTPPGPDKRWIPIDSESNKPSEKITIMFGDLDFCTKQGFAEARNLLLKQSPDECHILWVDSDEVHFPDQLAQLRVLLETSTLDIDDISMHFVHFCIGSNAYEKFEKRTTIFRKTSGTCWINKVHEKIVHADRSTRVTFDSSYIYHHYGYVRDQEVVFSRWRQYGLLEGQTNPSVDVEYPDHKVLEHRRASLLPYFGLYPPTIPEDWIVSKLIPI